MTFVNSQNDINALMMEQKLMRTPSFPLMRELPEESTTKGWRWEQHWPPIGGPFWLGEDLVGRRWLTKLRGVEHAYREIVFARLAQAMNWSCQSSIFIELDDESTALLGPENGWFNAAHFFLPEHGADSCGVHCPPHPWMPEIRQVEEVLKINMPNLIDWPKAELAVHLFGGHEPPDKLFTTAHELVIIDNELMFANGPVSFEGSDWWHTPGGKNLAFQICREFCLLPEESLQFALDAPAFVPAEIRDRIADCLEQSRVFAKTFCEKNEWLAQLSG
jgi:hypothetical protein